ncbi:MAG: hypothetical protein ACI9Y7_002803 [Dokdonia sp.]|jgi:hypothetical protein
MITYKRATSDKESHEILAIQKRNLKALLQYPMRKNSLKTCIWLSKMTMYLH